MAYDLYSEFNIEQHKKTYIHYLEIIILPTGKILYAVPSHQELLIQIGMKKFNKTREEFISMCPREYYFDYMDWLINVTDCIAVWTNGYKGKPNRFQQKQIDLLTNNGLIEKRY